jgi:hypothetical protein
VMPGGYHDEHITHYTRQSLTSSLTRHGFVHGETAYIARSELIMRFRKPESEVSASAESDPRSVAVGA